MVDLTIIGEWAVANPMLVMLILAAVLILNGLALYKAARKESIVWFWVILIFNTLGVLPLVYLIFSTKEKR